MNELIIWIPRQTITILGQSKTPQIPAINPLFEQYSFLATVVGLLAVIIPLAGYLLFKWKDADIEKAEVMIEESISAFFMKTVISESKRLFRLMDDHLPVALSKPPLDANNASRFDYLCKQLRDMPQEQLDDRGHYSGIIKEVFAGIVFDNANRLLEAVTTSEIVTANPVTNPTGIRFSLESNGSLRFMFVTEHYAKFLKNQKRYKIARSTVAYIAFSACVVLASALPAVLVDNAWMYLSAKACIGAFIFGLLTGLIALGVFYKSRDAIIKQQVMLKNDDALEHDFTSWRASNRG